MRFYKELWNCVWLAMVWELTKVSNGCEEIAENMVKVKRSSQTLFWPQQR